MRGYLNIFIFLYVFQCFFQTEFNRGSYVYFVIWPTGAHIGQFFRFAYIDHDIVRTGTFTDHLAGIHCFARFDKEFPSILQFVDSISKSISRFHSDQRTVDPHFDISFIRFESFQTVCNDGFSCRSRQQIATQTDDSAWRNVEIQVNTVVAGFHIVEDSFSLRNHFDGFPRKFFRDIDRQFFYRFAFLTVDFFNDYLRLSHLKLIAFPPHRFDQNTQMQYTTAVNDEWIRA